MARILVTGGAGFIGQHLVRHYVREGASVAVVDDLSTGRAADLPPTTELFVVDITDRAVADVIRRYAPDVVIHAAAQVSVIASMRDPRRDLEVNVVGTRNVLEGAPKRARFVFISTGGAIYGETKGADETHPIAPSSYYGAHKWTAERHIALTRSSYGIVRLANVYGPGQRSDLEGGVIAIFSERVRGSRPLEIYGDGGQRRDFVHVDDVVAAIGRVIAGRTSGVWNIGTGTATSVNELARLFAEMHDGRLEVKHLERRAGEIRNSVLNVERARRELGWKASISLREGLASLDGSTERGRVGNEPARPSV